LSGLFTRVETGDFHMTNEAIIIIAANTNKNESSRFIGKNESSRFISRSSLIVSAPPDDGGSPRLTDAAGSRGMSYKTLFDCI
jgi:hypothetical protein